MLVCMNVPVKPGRVSLAVASNACQFPVGRYGQHTACGLKMIPLSMRTCRSRGCSNPNIVDSVIKKHGHKAAPSSMLRNLEATYPAIPQTRHCPCSLLTAPALPHQARSPHPGNKDDAQSTNFHDEGS